MCKAAEMFFWDALVSIDLAFSLEKEKCEEFVLKNYELHVKTNVVLLKESVKRLMPIAYASDLLLSEENNLHGTQKKALILVWKFRQFRVFGLKYKIPGLKDHAVLAEFFRNRKLQRELTNRRMKF